jgi:ATP/maltotriose-dependent transcriptional regulator MalT
MVRGEWETTLALLEKSVSRWRDAGVVLVDWMHTGWLAHVHVLLGDTEAAMDVLDDAQGAPFPDLPVGPRSQLPLMRARLHLMRGETDDAERVASEVRDSFRHDEWPGLAARYGEIDAEIALARGDVERARALYDAAVAGTTRYAFVQLDAEFQVQWARGLNARGLPGATEHVDRAIALYREHGFSERFVERAETFR